LINDKELIELNFPILYEYAKGIQLNFESTLSLIILGESLIKFGEYDKGKIIILDLISPELNHNSLENQSEVLYSFGRSFIRLNEFKIALKYYYKSIIKTRGIKSVKQRTNILIEIINSLNEFLNFNISKLIINLIVKETRLIEISSDRSRLILSISEIITKIDDLKFIKIQFSKIELLTINIESSFYRFKTLTTISKNLYEIGNVEESRGLLNKSLLLSIKLEPKTLRIIEELRVAQLFNFIGDREISKNIILECIKNSYEIENLNDKFSTIINLSSLVILENEIEAGKKLISDSMNIAKELDDEFTLSWTLSNYIESIPTSIYGVVNLYFPQILTITLQMKISENRKNVLQSFSKAISQYSSLSVYSLFESALVSNTDIYDTVKSYAEPYRQINWEDSKSKDLFSYYVRSFDWVHFDLEFAKKGAFDFIKSLARLGKIEEAIESAKMMDIFSDLE
jgi:tetratricopeptide (TPR) repeat protein